MSIVADPNCCPKCGAPIPPEAPAGLCPKCLLLQAALPTEAGPRAAAKSAPPTQAELARAFPQLEILELIGQGGMGFVFKARQRKLERLVALKILSASLAADPAFAERFTREGRLLAQLSHPNIVTIHDFGQADGFFYLLMEFVDGVNLRQAMRIGRFTPAQALAIVPKICEALQFAHNEGILHRDIKPENILLDAKGRVKIADFGIAKLMDSGGRAGSPLPAESLQTQNAAHNAAEPVEAGVTRPAALTGTGKILGTPHYMAPEQLEKPQEVDHRADIYSLGVVFYEMLTGELPLGRFAPPSEKSTADPRLDEVVFRALEKEPARRTQTAGEVKTQVETIARSVPPPLQPGKSRGASASTALPLVPKWLKPAGIVFLLAGVAGFLHILIRFGMGEPAFNPWSLLVLTGVALLTRSQMWRTVALIVNPFVFALALLAFFNFPNKPHNPGTFVQMSIFLLLGSSIAAIISLCHRDVRDAFRILAQNEKPLWRTLKVMFACFATFHFVILTILLSSRMDEPPRQGLVRDQSVTNSAKGSAELWAPSLALDEKPDPQKILFQMQALTAAGRYDEALQMHIWYHNHALEYDSGQSGVRLSFALSDWIELGRSYPKAKSALIEIRDRTAGSFDEGRGNFARFQEVACINSYLQNDDPTFELFDKVEKNDKDLAKQCFFQVQPLWLKRGMYARYLKFVGDPEPYFEGLRKKREMERPVVHEMADGTFVDQTCQLIEVLVGTGQKPLAEKIRDQAVAVLDDARLKSAVSDAEKKINK